MFVPNSQTESVKYQALVYNKQMHRNIYCALVIAFYFSIACYVGTASYVGIACHYVAGIKYKKCCAGKKAITGVAGKKIMYRA